LFLSLHPNHRFNFIGSHPLTLIPAAHFLHDSPGDHLPYRPDVMHAVFALASSYMGKLLLYRFVFFLLLPSFFPFPT
jgi:hypothetical protein